MKCCFCKKECGPYGNNPAPFGRPKDRCCDNCNLEIVIPARLIAIKNKTSKEPSEALFDGGEK